MSDDMLYRKHISTMTKVYQAEIAKIVYKERLEEHKMKATSTQEIKNVKDIVFSIDNYPMETESKLTIVATTDDDIFAFEFEGPDLLQNCKKAGLFAGWEKDQQIRELERELNMTYECLKVKDRKYKKLEDEQPSTRSDILDKAKKCVCGQREQDYGTPESNFQLIADLWNGYLGGRTDNPVISVTPVDVSMMMALLKIARIRNGGGSGDSFVDLAGYAACGGEIWAEEKKQKDQN